MGNIESESESATQDRDSTCHATLLEVFGPLISDIKKTSIAREDQSQLPRGEVKELLELGFGALRVPKYYGGFGVSNVLLFKMIEDLSEADPNIAQIFRAHFAFVEGRLGDHDQAIRDKWLPVIGGGALVGSAMAEDFSKESIIIDRSNNEIRINGEKKYSTGSIFADWLYVSALDNSTPVGVMVSSTSTGLQLLNDWSGFGQRLSGSGTTIFDSVQVFDDDFVFRYTGVTANSYGTAFYQLILIAILSGISKAILRDSLEYVQAKLYNVGTNGKIKPKYDPLVQRVIGRLSSISFAVESTVEKCALLIDQAAASQTSSTCVEELSVKVTLQVFQSQVMAIDLVLEAATLMFEVGGASATDSRYLFDRHWRNARTIASHNPVIYKECSIGNYFLNGVSPLKFSYPSSLFDESEV